LADLVGVTLGQYEIIALQGEGGMATVYKAWQPALQRYVALKVLALRLSGEADFVARFQQEAVAAANLRHNNIVTIYDVGSEQGRHYIAMEFIEGESLKDCIDREGALALDQVVDIITQVGGALDYAHQRGFIHRDIKPANVLIEQTGRVVLTDFGIVEAHDNGDVTPASIKEGAIFGTPHYMSPEQIGGEPLDPRSDLYSLGVVCYEMLSGRVPFDGSTRSILYAHTHTPPPSFRETVGPGLPSPLEGVVDRALAKHPADRFSSAGQFATALSEAAAGVWSEGVPDGTLAVGQEGGDTDARKTRHRPKTSQPQSTPARRSRWALLFGATGLGVALVVGAILGVVLLLGDGDAPDKMLADAQVALVEGRYEEAIGTFEQALEEDADNAAVLKRIGQAYEAQEKWQQAADWYEKWTQVVPDDPEARYELGWAYYQLEYYEEAAAQFGRVTGLRPEWATGFEGLGKSLFNSGDFERAAKALERWADLEPTSDEVSYFLGTNLYNLGRYDDSIRYLEAFVQSHPSEEVHRRLGWTYFNLNRYKDAVKQFSEAIRLHESANAFRGLGSSYYKLGKYGDAANAYSQWVALVPGSAEAYRSLGWARHHQGQYEEAVAAFENSLQLETNPGSYRGLGLSFEKTKNYQGAVYAFERWIELSPNEAEAYLRLGWAHYYLNQYNDAIPMFQRAAELGSGIAEAYRGLGASYVALDDHHSALLAYEQWTEIEAGNARAFRAIGWEYLALQRYEEAALAFTRSIQLQEHESGYYGLAEAHRRQGDCEKAIPNYERALELRPGDAMMQAGLEACR
jgi:tetratricopeptide (TPR) repeat protein